MAAAFKFQTIFFIQYLWDFWLFLAFQLNGAVGKARYRSKIWEDSEQTKASPLNEDQSIRFQCKMKLTQGYWGIIDQYFRFSLADLLDLDWLTSSRCGWCPRQDSRGWTSHISSYWRWTLRRPHSSRTVSWGSWRRGRWDQCWEHVWSHHHHVVVSQEKYCGT